MYGRTGLDRFRKAQSLEPFSVSSNNAAAADASKTAPKSLSNNPSSSFPQQLHTQYHSQQPISEKPVGPEVVPNQHFTQMGGGQSAWQPPEWAIEPRSGVYYLEVIKDGEVLDKVYLDKRRNIFGRQLQTCDFVLDHQSVSRQHAAVVPHKNGSIYVIDLGSAHGTFVANERLSKDSPVELEVGQSLRFAASTRTYILRKNDAALFPPVQPTEINIPPPPDPSDEEAVLAYNTYLNRYGLGQPKNSTSISDSGSLLRGKDNPERAAKRIRRIKVGFRDQVGGELVEIVGISDGFDVGTEPGPVGVKEGSLIGKYESLVQITVIPKGKEQSSPKEVGNSQTGVTEKLKQVLNKVKASPPTEKGGGIYDGLYGELFSGKVGSSWAYSSIKSGDGREVPSSSDPEGKADSTFGRDVNDGDDDDDDDDLFG